MSFFRRLVAFLRRLFGVASNADDFALIEIGGTGEPQMADITLAAGQSKAFRIVPNKGDTTFTVTALSVDGSTSGDGYIGLGPYESEPGNPAAFRLTHLAQNQNPPHVSTLIAAVDPGTGVPIEKHYNLIALPENADDFAIEEIV